MYEVEKLIRQRLEDEECHAKELIESQKIIDTELNRSRELQEFLEKLLFVIKNDRIKPDERVFLFEYKVDYKYRDCVQMRTATTIAPTPDKALHTIKQELTDRYKGVYDEKSKHIECWNCVISDIRLIGERV